MKEEKVHSVIMTGEELRLFSEFLCQKENSALDGVLTPASLDPIQPPALGGPNKGVLGVIEKAAPRVLMKMASDNDQREFSKLGGPSSKGGALMRFKRNQLAKAVKGSFRGIGHDRAVKGGYLKEWNQVGLDTIKEAKKRL